MRFSPPLAEPPAIAAAVLWLPSGRQLVEDAVAAGRLDRETAERLGYSELTESPDRAAPEMAVLAAQKALAEAGWSAADVGIVVHSWIYHQGHDFWSPPHYVAHQVGAPSALPIGVHQTSNGCVAGIEVAATRLAVDPTIDRCLVTTADCFPAPGFDRWLGDIDVGYGDGATALLLDRTAGPYRLLSIVSSSAAEYEVLYRGDDEFSPAPRWRPGPVDVRRTKLVFAGGGLLPRFVAAGRRAVLAVVAGALAEAGVTPDDRRVRCLTLPRIGAGALAQFYAPVLRELGLDHADVLDLGRRTGHLGAGDSVANLADLHSADRIAPGEIALLLSAGNGFTWSCIALQRQE